MSKHIHVLYLSDANYAAFAGVSVVSLFENNKSFDEIDVWLIDDDLGDENRKKFKEAADAYGRRVHFLDMSEGIRKLEAIGAPKYRNSYTTYLKLFAFGLLPPEVDRIFFIDSDSVVTGDLSALPDFDMHTFKTFGTSCLRSANASYYFRSFRCFARCRLNRHDHELV